MFSLLKLTAFAVLFSFISTISVSADENTPTDQAQLSPIDVDVQTAFVQYLLKNLVGYTLLSVDDSKCPASSGSFNAFTSGTGDFGIETGILLSAACEISAVILVPQTSYLTTTYYFYTPENTNPNTGAIKASINDAFTVSVENPTDSNEVVYGVNDLINVGTGVKTSGSPPNTAVQFLPIGEDKVTFKITNNVNPGKVSEVAIGPVSIVGIKGDPQFTGFLNQNYQVHGMSNAIYNIISTPSFQYNALFTYLSKGKCRIGTQCFSHPGNYFGQIGIMIKDNTNKINKILIDSGKVDEGLILKINDEIISIGSSRELGSYKVTLLSKFEVAVESSEFSIVLQNSDMFINQMIAIGSKLQSSMNSFTLASKVGKADDMLPTLPHGVLGQTWQYKTYQNRWKYIEGQLFDYVQTDGIFGTANKFNRFIGA